ncbi:hypothetical protein GQ464_015245 [Rhodocaloribacter litoris]|uniref:hypothetical protein n=1 Tax=Rhodocaloribacter litoris TaxID=2558931 RepID=UPI00142329EF|nr:hypothetical protein [Rhodocaloribacter litoris]QXD14763.1 hypothetical protein GQ464_015245 [Rhodocaloribacter litoris]GIV59151.1 MAG: hypothetical protein KatS3mg043_0240 [Rhodothermaceae bacterium]
MHSETPLIHVFEDAVNALLDLAELDGTDAMIRAVIVALESLNVALSEGELPESAMHAPARVRALIEVLSAQLPEGAAGTRR